ncbi:MAG: asparagine synthase (glutamine-hydrolyzing) [Desulfobulbaceae bacterium]|nr:asparagine synthase (glutamine-hydrolyzing) [Desulfobulbaceae bacterium]
MCGICGFNWNDQALVSAMNRSLAHRGPDQEGTYCAGEMSLGHRRLSIIDLSEQGRQPIFNEDRTVCLVFNGEIYNFRELRSDLVARGHRFQGRSDSEVIVHAYEEYGEDCLARLRGMFAFAVYDIPAGRLFIARDRIGIKPLYYYWKDGKFIFASEIKAILEDRSIERQVNPQALYDYLGFEFVPAPETMFKNISKLPAGHYLRLEKGKLVVRQYWDLKMGAGTARGFSYEEAVEKQKQLLDEAVRSHLVSDVPLGVFLSGGLDSSAIVALMRRHISGPIRTFTIGYADKTFSELDYAEQVARHCGTEHQVLMLDDIRPQYVETALYHLDEPMTDLSTVPLYLLSKQVREYVTVCLSGEGADESYAGYDRFKAARMARWYNFLPGPVKKQVIGKLAGLLPDQPQKKGAVNMLKRFIEGANLPVEGDHLRWQYFLNDNLTDNLFTREFLGSIAADPFRLVREYAEKCGTTDEVNRQIYLDMRYMMTESVLMKVDKMSMASSLEVRVPLLDHVLVEYLASLPGDWKLKGMTTKYIFRSALEELLPRNIVHRGKQGYSLPVKHLLRGELKPYMVTLLNESPLIRQVMDIRYVNRLIDEHSAMKHNHNHTLWALMNLSIWYNRFFS